MEPTWVAKAKAIAARYTTVPVHTGSRPAIPVLGFSCCNNFQETIAWITFSFNNTTTLTLVAVHDSHPEHKPNFRSWSQNIRHLTKINRGSNAPVF